MKVIIFHSVFIIPIGMWLFYLIDFFSDGKYNVEDEKISKMKNLILILNIPKTSIYLLSGILTLIEKNKLVNEIKSSPLITVDDTLTEDIYKNIILQSKNPDDQSLKDQYKSMIENRISKIKNSNLNNTRSLGASDGSEIIGVKPKGESINYNGEVSKLNRKSIYR